VKSGRPRQTLLLILIPMILTFCIQRLILHHSSPDSHVFIAGYLVHHLFTGILIQIPAAFALAFGIRSNRLGIIAKLLMGVSSAMVLDEVIFLICTDGSGQAYRGKVSLGGAFVLITLASGVLLGTFWATSRAPDGAGTGPEPPSSEPRAFVSE